MAMVAAVELVAAMFSDSGPPMLMDIFIALRSSELNQLDQLDRRLVRGDDQEKEQEQNSAKLGRLSCASVHADRAQKSSPPLQPPLARCATPFNRDSRSQPHWVQ